MHHRRLVLLGLVGAGLAHALPTKAATAQVVIDNFTFSPEILKIAVGTTVTFTNRDDLPHTVVSDAQPPIFKSKALDTDDSFTFTFDKAGTYRYFCGLHPHMNGTVEVA